MYQYNQYDQCVSKMHLCLGSFPQFDINLNHLAFFITFLKTCFSKNTTSPSKSRGGRPGSPSKKGRNGSPTKASPGKQPAVYRSRINEYYRMAVTGRDL